MSNGVKKTSSGVPVDKSRLAIIQETTARTLDKLPEADLKDPVVVESEILRDVNMALETEMANRNARTKQTSQNKNSGSSGGSSGKSKTSTKKTPKCVMAPLKELMPAQIADILIRSYPVARIAAAGLNADEDQDILAVYQYDGEDKGTYVASNTMFRKLIRQYNYGITTKGSEEVMAVLMEKLPRRTICNDRNLVAVNNGIFNYDTEELEAFSEDRIFLTKSHVNFVDNAKNPVITEPTGEKWDVESWMNSLSDDPDIVNLLWEILGAIIRPLVSWNKSAWFYSESGNNGKGTLCELMRQLCGEGTYASIPLASFSQEFMLEPLIRASAIIVDENDVGTYIDKTANLKAVITGDMLSINRKFKTPVAFDFHGFMVQCLNELPRVRDKSDSFFRRQLFVPFTKCFTGHEKKYIKNDYLKREDVLEYVMYRVLKKMPDYYQLSEPQACVDALEEYKDYNDPTRQFLNDFLSQAQWDLLPYSFIYDVYRGWYKKSAGGDGKMKGKAALIKDVKSIIEEDYPEWEVCEHPVSPGALMDRAEPMIAEYNLEDWKNPLYNGSDTEKICHPKLSGSYRGLRRLYVYTDD